MSFTVSDFRYITLRDDLTFSDGEPVTIDDLIFSLYVLCDPAYNGPSILGEMPIQGLEEYQADYIRLSALLYQLGEDNTDFSQVTQEEQDAFWAAVDGPLTEFDQAMLDLDQAEEEWQTSNRAERRGRSHPPPLQKIGAGARCRRTPQPGTWAS